MKRDKIETIVFITLAVLAVVLTALRGNILYFLAFAVIVMGYTYRVAPDAGKDNDNF